MGSGFSKMKKQARMMQQQMEQMRTQMQSKEIIGTSGNGLVTVTINGEKELKSIKILPDCVDKNDVEGLQDLIHAALHNAYATLSKESPQEFGLPF